MAPAHAAQQQCGVRERLTPDHATQAMEAAMDELQTKHLIPLQKQAFVCSAACCDKHATNIQALQEW